MSVLLLFIVVNLLLRTCPVFLTPGLFLIRAAPEYAKDPRNPHGIFFLALTILNDRTFSESPSTCYVHLPDIIIDVFPSLPLSVLCITLSRPKVVKDAGNPSWKGARSRSCFPCIDLACFASYILQRSSDVVKSEAKSLDEKKSNLASFVPVQQMLSSLPPV
jgi:hypothetical protein